MGRHGWLCGACFLALTWSGAAVAQSAEVTPAQRVDPTAATPTPTPTPAPAPTTADDPGEVVVTAQRRAQRLVDVPISVTSISGDALEKQGVNALVDVTKTAPGVVLDKNGAYLQPVIRGIGTSNTGPGADPNVAVYVDGVYQSSQTGNFFELANVADVEILKGPQGTLFGRNATGGAILIKLLEPSFQTTGKFNVSYGRFNEALASGYVSTGLNDKIAVDLSAYYRRSDGWIHDLQTGADRNRQHSFDIRSKLLFQATDTLKFILSVAHNDTSDPTGLAQTANNGDSAGALVPGGQPIATQRGTLSMNLAPAIQVRSTSVSLTGSLDTGIGTLASITSYRHEKSDISADLDGSYAAVSGAVYQQVFDDFTQEVNLTSKPGSALSYVVGVFYFHEHSGDPFFNINGNPLYHAFLTTDAVSAYADGTYKIGKLSLILGGRYSTERKAFLYGAGANPYNPEVSARFSKFTPRAGLSFALDRSSNVYFTYSKGFKSGTYNLSSPSTTPVLQEGVDAFEVGYKRQGTFVSFNASAYHYDYSNIQITAFDFNAGLSRLINAAKAEIYGADADATFHFSSQFDLRAAVAYTHAQFTSFPGAIVFTPKPANNGNVSSIIDASGNPLVRAPRFTASATANYRVDLGAHQADLSLTPYYTTKIYYSFDKRIVQPAYFTLDGSLGYTIDRLRLYLYARNMTDKVYATFRSETSLRDGVTFASPRTFGVGAGYKF